MKSEIEPTELGRLQFIEYESCGIRPENPDFYFLGLEEGKKWFNVQQTDIKNSYLTWEWDGWYRHWIDFKGERWVLKDLMSWHDNPPNWLFKEDHELSEEDKWLHEKKEKE